jgi:hypothetical protein
MRGGISVFEFTNGESDAAIAVHPDSPRFSPDLPGRSP